MTEKVFKELQLLILTQTRNYISLMTILNACTNSECFIHERIHCNQSAVI